MAKKQSKADRWSEAVTKAKDAREKLGEIKTEIEEKIESVIAEAKQEAEDKINALLAEYNDQIDEAKSDLEAGIEDLKTVHEEYGEWYENMPDGLKNGEKGEKLSEIANIDVDIEPEFEIKVNIEIAVEIEENLDSIESGLDDAEGADLP